MVAIDWPKVQARAYAARLQIQENIVRTRLEHGDALRADEIAQGVRLSHEEFLYLARKAMPALNAELAES